MIVYGSRMYGRRNAVKGWGRCANCGKYVQHVSYNGRKWGHLYFIPIIPAGPRVRVLKECPKCRHGLHIPEDKAPGMVAEMRQLADKALEALASDKTTLEGDPAKGPVSCAAALCGQIELLLCLQGAEHVMHMVAKLAETGPERVRKLVLGKVHEFRGELAEAEAMFKESAESDPNDPVPVTLMAALCQYRKDPKSAQLLYERALELSPMDPYVMGSLVELYTERKDYAKLAAVYERIFAITPDFAKDKKVLKAYKKACRKSGRTPAVK